MVPADVPPHVRLVASTISQCRAVIPLNLLFPSARSHAFPDCLRCSEERSETRSTRQSPGVRAARIASANATCTRPSSIGVNSPSDVMTFRRPLAWTVVEYDTSASHCAQTA